MDDLEARYRVRFDTLDIGGGFPVAYDKPVASIEDHRRDPAPAARAPCGANSTSSPSPGGCSSPRR